MPPKLAKPHATARHHFPTDALRNSHKKSESFIKQLPVPLRNFTLHFYPLASSIKMSRFILLLAVLFQALSANAFGTLQ
jgi:hypothetical protein